MYLQKLNERIRDQLDIELQSLLRQWTHSFDVLFTIHPEDGSLLTWYDYYTLYDNTTNTIPRGVRSLSTNVQKIVKNPIGTVVYRTKSCVKNSIKRIP